MTHPLGVEFPREGFVQAALNEHFAHWERVEGGTQDLVCFDADSDIHWVIEAKGETSDTGLDFRTGLGQLLSAMDQPKADYALAMPDTPRFARLRAQIPDWVRKHLNLHWLLIDEAGEVSCLRPED